MIPVAVVHRLRSEYVSELVPALTRYGIEGKSVFDIRRLGQSHPRFNNCKAVLYFGEVGGHADQTNARLVADGAGLPLFYVSRHEPKWARDLAPVVAKFAEAPANEEARPKLRITIASPLREAIKNRPARDVIRSSIHEDPNLRLTGGDFLIKLMPKLAPPEDLPQEQKDWLALYEAENAELRHMNGVAEKANRALTRRAEAAERKLLASAAPLPNGNAPIGLRETVQAFRVAASHGFLSGVELADLILAKLD